jgi:hypothetical protein
LQRLSLIHSPIGNNDEQNYSHHIRYALYGHTGTWNTGGTAWAARRFCQPLIGKTVAQAHAGAMGKAFSFAKCSSLQMRVMAIKKAENTNDIIVRVVESQGSALSNGTVTFPAAISAAREVNGQEIDKGTASSAGSGLTVSLRGYQPRAYALTLTPPAGSNQLSRLQISPANPTVQPGLTVALTATGVNQYGVPVTTQPSVTWSVSGGGSAAAGISSSGVFTAGSDTGTCTITATAAGSPGVTGSTTVRVVRQIAQLCYKYYTGDFSSLSAMTAATPSQTGLISTIIFPTGSATTSFGLRYSGSIYIPANGEYTFFMTADDEAALKIDNTTILSTTWQQGEQSSSPVTLVAGFHDIALDYRQGNSGLGISVSWQGPGITKQTIPASALFHLTCDNSTSTAASAQSHLPASFGFSTELSKQDIVIRIAMPALRATPISVDIFDIRGRLAASTTIAKADAGYHMVHFNRSHLSNGHYACRISAGEYRKTGTFLVGM